MIRSQSRVKKTLFKENLMKNYSLLDSGNYRKLEQFGPIILSRPCASAAWSPTLNKKHWQAANAIFWRDPKNRWDGKEQLPTSWNIDIAGLTMQLQATDFGHLGLFPEQQLFWRWIQSAVKKRLSEKKSARVLNLFAYSGAASLAAAKAGAEVCHVDASQGMVSWARDNATLNGLEKAPVRWIVDDVTKFLKREVRRQKQYDAILLDPPSFGRGNKGEIFKIEEDLLPLLSLCKQLLSTDPFCVILSCHTPGYTPTVLHHLLAQTMKNFSGSITQNELFLEGSEKPLPIPLGAYARWSDE